jgi:hypothetical protein
MHLALSGSDHAEDGQWEEAAVAFSTAIEKSGNSPTLRRQIAHWCRKLAGAQEASNRQDLAEKASEYATALVAELDSEAEVVTSRDDGWAPIFDGETLNGWKANENKRAWTIEDGAIVAQGPRSHLFYVGDAEPFVNFEFVCDVMTAPGSNSGIFFHTKYQERGFLKSGLEAQLNVSNNQDPRKTGSLWGVVTVEDPPCRDDEYWTQHIIVRGKRVIVAVNGKKVVDYTEPEGPRAFSGGVPEPTSAGVRRLGSGTFALQSFTGKVFFKNIRVKRLP